MPNTDTVGTHDANVAAWLHANDLRFLHVETTSGPRARFVFDDSDHRADSLLAEYMRSERIQRLAVARGRFGYLLQALRRSGQTIITAEEFDRVSRRRLQA